MRISMQFFAEETDIANQTSTSLKRGLRKLEKRIKEHESYIENPAKHCSGWNIKSISEQKGLKKHWLKEISNFKKSIQNRVDELKKRGDLDE